MYIAPAQLQRRLASLVIAPNKPRYTSRMAFRLSGNLDVERLAQAVDRTVARHELLRSRFRWLDGVAWIAPAEDHLRPRLLQEKVEPEVIQEKLRADGFTEFDVWNGPLAKFALYDVGADGWYLSIAVDHYIFDGWSSEVLLADLGSAYRNNDDLHAPRATYADFTAWQDDLLAGEEADQLVDYWRTLIGDCPRHLVVPGFEELSPELKSHGYELTVPIETELLARARSASRSSRAGDFAYWLAAVGLALHRVSGATQIPIHFNTANRAKPEFAEIVGYLTHGLLMPVRIVPGESLPDYLSGVVANHRAALRHQSLPYARMIAELFADDMLEVTHPPHVYFDCSRPVTLDLSGVAVTAVPIPATFADAGVSVWTRLDDPADLLLLCQTIVEPDSGSRILAEIHQAASDLADALVPRQAHPAGPSVVERG